MRFSWFAGAPSHNPGVVQIISDSLAAHVLWKRSRVAVNSQYNGHLSLEGKPTSTLNSDISIDKFCLVRLKASILGYQVYQN